MCLSTLWIFEMSPYQPYFITMIARHHFVGSFGRAFVLHACNWCSTDLSHKNGCKYHVTDPWRWTFIHLQTNIRFAVSEGLIAKYRLEYASFNIHCDVSIWVNKFSTGTKAQKTGKNNVQNLRSSSGINTAAIYV